jgi:serine/threonine protein phosphatase PrpC
VRVDAFGRCVGDRAALTIAGVVLRPDQTITFNVGDSRIYGFEDGELSQISRDHTAKSGALLQCLGGLQEPVPLLVHVHRLRGRVILVCSDGLTDMLSDQQIAAVLTSDPVDPATSLVDAAVAAGGHDNVSAIVIQGLRAFPQQARSGGSRRAQ